MNALNPTERNKFWSDIMEQYKSSGRTRKDFCDQNNLSFSKFRNWHYKLNRKHRADKTVPFDNKFIPLVVTDPPISKEITPAHTIDLKLDPSGNISISIPSQFNLEYLNSLLTMIRRTGC